MKVYFWPHTTDVNIASYRLRCLMVMQELAKRGVDVKLFGGNDKPEVLVLSKRYGKASLAKALELKRRYGTKIILDICDNHFYYEQPVPAATRRADRLRKAVESVDTVVSSTDYLANVVRQETGDVTPVVVIGDLVPSPHHYNIYDAIRHPIAYYRYLNLKSNLKGMVPKHTNLVWFGNHGGNLAYGGMNDLINIKDYLLDLNKKTPITLTIISNSKKKYTALTKELGIRTFYVPWHKYFISSLLFLHDISVIPVSRNPFTLAKTSNRVTTSLCHGLHVVADSIPSYGDLHEYIYLDCWASALNELTKGRVTLDVGRLACEIKNNNSAVVDGWRNLLVCP